MKLLVRVTLRRAALVPLPNASSLPSDVTMTTSLNGAIVPFVVRLETGTMDRGRNPGDDFTDTPFNAAGSSRTGVAGCFLNNGETLREAYLNGEDINAIGFAPVAVAGGPCTNLGVFSNGKVLPKHAKGNGFTYRLNAQWKPQSNLMFYATWSKGFRPGGINRRGDIGPYNADYLYNIELGWKTTFGPSWRSASSSANN